MKIPKGCQDLLEDENLQGDIFSPVKAKRSLKGGGLGDGVKFFLPFIAIPVGRERWVLLKFYWEGWTEEEIALELGISQQAVSKVKQRALQKTEGTAERAIVRALSKDAARRAKEGE